MQEESCNGKPDCLWRWKTCLAQFWLIWPHVAQQLNKYPDGFNASTESVQLGYSYDKSVDKHNASLNKSRTVIILIPIKKVFYLYLEDGTNKLHLDLIIVDLMLTFICQKPSGLNRIWFHNDRIFYIHCLNRPSYARSVTFCSLMLPLMITASFRASQVQLYMFLFAADFSSVPNIIKTRNISLERN